MKKQTVGDIEVSSDEQRLEIAKQKLDNPIEVPITRKGKSDKRIIPRGKISTENKKLILDFDRYKDKQGIGASRRIDVINVLAKVAGILGDKSFEDVAQSDIVEAIEESTSRCKKPTTYNLVIREVKSLYSWMWDEEPERVSKLFSKKRLPMKPITSEYYDRRGKILTWDEVVKISAATKSLRDQVLIQFLAASGCRKIEVRHMRIRDIVSSPSGRVTFTVIRSKTAKGLRTQALPRSPQPQPGVDKLLLDYINRHPYRNDKDSALFFGREGKRLSDTQIARIIYDAAERANISKPHHPHCLRWHSMSVKGEYLNDQENKAYHGQDQDSQCLRNYVHLDAEKLQAKVSGESTVNNEAMPGERQCFKCKHINGAGLLFCMECGVNLDEKEEEKTEVDEYIKAECEKRGVSPTQVWCSLLSVYDTISKQKNGA